MVVPFTYLTCRTSTLGGYIQNVGKTRSIVSEAKTWKTNKKPKL